eukprot:gene10878-11032_t
MELPEIEESDNDYLAVFKQAFDAECVEFSVGNPRVEHITGIVHLYKRTTATPAVPGLAPNSTAAEASEVEPAAGDDTTLTVCCLAIPADMSVAQFCTFIGAYLGEVRSIQVLRRDGTQPSLCMVLLTFATQDQADSFHHDFNGQPFSSLEPEILCRLVFVRSVEVLSSRGRPTPVSQLPPVAKAATAEPLAVPAVGLTEACEWAEGPGSQQASPAATHSPGSAQLGAAAPAAEASSAAQVAPPLSSAATESESTTGAKPVYASADSRAALTPGSSSGAIVSSLDAKAPPFTPKVCLERLDEHISGVVTTVCNHRFHGECLKRWGDTSCPVCRYCMYSSSTNTSRCAACGTNANLWICLICGHVGCGRYKEGHASDHWKESAHCYALELETQRVWDYAGDGHSSPGHPHHRHRTSASCRLQLDRGRSGRSCGYGTAAAAGAADHSTDVEDESCGSSSCPVCANEEMKEAELSASVNKVREERDFLRSLNETLLANQKDFGVKLKDAQQALAASEAQVQDLQEQVRDLMVYIEAQRTIQSETGSELQDATLLPVPSPSKPSSSRRRGRK